MVIKKGKKKKVYGVILASGAGSRFWSLSRVTTPKQVLRVAGEESLLKATIKRLTPLITPTRVYIVTSEEQANTIREHLTYDGKPVSSGYIIEPTGRNTASAIGLAALELYRKEPDVLTYKGERIDLYSARRKVQARKPGYCPARNHRGAERQLR